MVQRFKLSIVNFAVTWKLITERYKNEPLIEGGHLKTICEVGPGNKET